MTDMAKNGLNASESAPRTNPSTAVTTDAAVGSGEASSISVMGT